MNPAVIRMKCFQDEDLHDDDWKNTRSQNKIKCKLSLRFSSFFVKEYKTLPVRICLNAFFMLLTKPLQNISMNNDENNIEEKIGSSRTKQ